MEDEVQQGEIEKIRRVFQVWRVRSLESGVSTKGECLYVVRWSWTY